MQQSTLAIEFNVLFIFLVNLCSTRKKYCGIWTWEAWTERKKTNDVNRYVTNFIGSSFFDWM